MVARNVVITSVLALAMAAVGGAPTAANSVGSGVSDPVTGAAIKFRETFGLDVSPETLAAAASDPTYSAEPYGVLLSPGEIAELQRRVGVERAVSAAARFAAEQPEWAGYYIDQLDRGTPVFMFTSRIDSLAPTVRDLIPEGVAVHFKVVDRSLAELTKLADTVFSDREQLRQNGIALTGLGTDIVRNAVEVNVESVSPEAASRLARDYGPGVYVRQGEYAVSDTCSSTDNCRPAKGGLHIHNQTRPDGANDCTSGFVVRRYRDGAWPLAILTAGHCIAGDPVNTPWEHNNSFLGNSKYQTWGSTAVPDQERESDVGLIEIDSRSGNLPTTDNEFYVYNGSIHVLRAVTYIPTINQTTGSQACVYGFHSNQSHCTVILRVDWRHSSVAWGVTHWISNTVEYDWNQIDGDSGGPVYQVWGSDRAVLGTHVHSQSGGGSAGYGWYTPYPVGQSDYATVTAADGHADSYYLCTDANC